MEVDYAVLGEEQKEGEQNQEANDAAMLEPPKTTMAEDLPVVALVHNGPGEPVAEALSTDEEMTNDE